MPATAPAHGRIDRFHAFGVFSTVVIFAFGQVLLTGHPQALRWWTDLFWTTSSLLSGIECFRLARDLPSPNRYAWQLFGAACLIWFLGMVYWDYRELVRGDFVPFPAFSDLGFLLFAPLFSLGLLFYRSHVPSIPFSLMEFSQLGIVVSAIALIHVTVLYQPISTLPQPPLYLVTALAYPALFMALLAQATTTLWTLFSGRARQALIYLVGAIVAHAVADSLYAYSLLGHAYDVGSFFDVAWVLGFALIYQGAKIYAVSPEEEPRALHETLPRTLRTASLPPIIAVMLTAGTLVVFHNDFSLSQIELMLPAGIALLVFVAIREWASNIVREQQLQDTLDSEKRFRRLFEANPAIMGISRLADGRFLDVNTAFERATGWFREDIIGRTSVELGLWPSAEERERAITAILNGQSKRDIEFLIHTRHGEARQLLGSVDVIQVKGETYLFVVASDVTERKQTELEMRKLSSAIQQTADAVIITDEAGRIEYVNPAWEQLTGYSFAEIHGKTPSMLKSGRQGEPFYRTLWERISSGKVFSEVFVNKRQDGSLFYEEQTITPLKNSEGHITHFVATGRDITERMQAQEQLHHLAHHDALTDLPNRTLLLDRLKQALARARWYQRAVATLFIDLDRFKDINDTLGHDMGDKLLCQVSERITTCLRDRDTVARFGGDEFVVLLDDLARDEDVRALAQKLLDELAPPFEVDGSTLRITASIGISLYPNDGEDSSTLLKNADIAMYRAKERGRNSYQFYSADMTARAFTRLTLENSLREALAREEFRLYYQPQVDTRTGVIVGAEALLRWQHPERGLITPDEFVPLLEDTGLIAPVGAWVLNTACAQLADWRQLGWKNLRMSVNISSHQFTSTDLTELIGRILADHNLPPTMIELEITESTLMRHDALTEQLLESLAGMKLRLAVDDFGTGYSSLAYLRHLSIDTLKIDRSFVRDIPGDEDDTAVARAIIGLGHSLRLDLVAEGVETHDQLRCLQSLGCHVVQGYLYSRPVPAPAFTQFLVNGGHLATQPAEPASA